MNILCNKFANFYEFPFVFLTIVLLTMPLEMLPFVHLSMGAEESIPQQNLHDFADIHSHEAG